LSDAVTLVELTTSLARAREARSAALRTATEAREAYCQAHDAFKEAQMALEKHIGRMTGDPDHMTLEKDQRARAEAVQAMIGMDWVG
jgi:hypothetical protein